MQHIMSVSGEEVSRCQLEGCQLVLKSTPLGLRLYWLTNEGGKHVLHSAAKLSNVKSSGSLYPVFMDSATALAIFMNAIPARRSDASRDVPSAALVVSGQRTVLAAHCKLPGQCIAVCSSAQSVLWTGIMKVDNTSVMVVVSKGTTVNFGRVREDHTSTQSKLYHYDRLLWTTKSLPAAPIACCGHQNMLLFSDGALSWLCHISFSENDEIILKSNNLCIRGIIKIMNKEKIEMFSCDGRKYICTWSYLNGKNGTKNWKPSVNVNDSQQLHTVTDIMKVIEKCSSTINMEGTTIQTLVLYIKQLSLAQRLLTDKKRIFHPTVRVEKSMENKDHLAIVQLSKTEDDVDLRGRWWALCTVISGVTGNSVSTTKLTEEQLRSNVCETKLILPPLDFPTTSRHTDIQVYLVLESFTSDQPVCKVLACQAQIDILNFLESECNLSTCFLERKFGTIKVINSSKTSVVSTSVKKTPVPSCKLSVSFTNTNKTLELLCRILNITVSNNNEERTSTETSLWYMDKRIDVTCTEEDKKLIVQLKGSNSYVVLSVKAALERRVKDLKQCITSVTLSSSILREAHYTYRLLNYEENCASRINTTSHLYHAVVMLLSFIPLS